MKRKLVVTTLKGFSRIPVLLFSVITILFIFNIGYITIVIDFLSPIDDEYYTDNSASLQERKQERIIRNFINDSGDVFATREQGKKFDMEITNDDDDGRDQETFNHLNVVTKSPPLNEGTNDMMNTVSLPLAILHIGPHKTGSTTIQAYTKRFVKELAMDGYEMPWVEIGGWESQVQLATCFLNKSTVHPVYPCDQRLVEAARNISKRNSRILISSEAFDRPDVNMTSLKDFIKPWNVTVVYVYRRFYSWLQSNHNQLTKRAKLETFLENSTDYLRSNITDFIHQEITNSTGYVDRFTAAQRFQREFNNNVIILNMHNNDTDIVEQFFCRALPHAENTCDALKKYGDGETVHNPSRLLTYSDLAYRAHHLGLIRITSQEHWDAAVRLIEQHQKVTLKLSDKDFDVVCPDRAMLDQLLEVSLEMERLMVAEFFASPSGESELRSDFEKQAKSSLCSIDLTGTIESSNWKGFFASLNDSLQSVGQDQFIHNASSIMVNTKQALASYKSIEHNMKPNAILHIGPHRTGSTSIQILSTISTDELAKDGYEMPRNKDRTDETRFAYCFIPQPQCDLVMLERARNISERNNSILISSEEFDSPQVDMTLLQAFLKPWNVTVVYVYRRFYSWLQSHHNQVSQVLMLETFIANRTDYLRTNITDFIMFANITRNIDRFTAALKYRREFDNVVILNMHDKSSNIVRQFFCHAMPHAKNTCNAVMTHKDEAVIYNTSRLMIYFDLAYRAHRLGLIRITSQEQLDAAVNLIEQHQKVTLKLSDKDFDMICPDRAILDQLLETSLEMEKVMVPEFFATSSGESELRSDFEKQAKSSLCSVDLSGTIESSNWKEFFASLNGDLQHVGRTGFVQDSFTVGHQYQSSSSSDGHISKTTRPNAVLHVGPHKTGTTTIQAFTKRLVKELAMDGYEMPWVEIGGWENQVQLAACFLNKPFTSPMYPCDQRLVEAARNISKRNNSIMISSECFDDPDIDVTLLKEFLRPWNVTVVYGYRRFYSWLQSNHNQITKRTKLETYIANSTDFLRTNITYFIHQVISNRTPYIDMFTAAQRYQRGFDNNVILNMHEKNTDEVQQFFCHAMPHTVNTCNAIMTSGDVETLYNPSRLLTYYDLAYRAHRLGLIRISSKDKLDTAVMLIEQHQKVTLKRSDKDFDMMCPDRAMLDQLLEISLHMEKLILPEFFASPSGEDELRSDFDKQAKSSLCSVDLTGTIESSNWKGFFASLNDRLSSLP